MTLTLHQFPGFWNLTSASPFCVKLETCFRMYQIPYQVAFCEDFSEPPKGKVPYVTWDGETLGDSGLIISKLQEQKMITDHLSPEDLAWTRLVEEHLYFAMVWFRWADDTNFSTLKNTFFNGLPPHLQEVVPNGAREKVLANLKGQGMGLHCYEEVASLGTQDIDALAARLGDGPFFNGEKPGILDAVVFGLITNILVPQLPSPLRDAVRNHPNLVKFNDRVTQDYFAPQAV